MPCTSSVVEHVGEWKVVVTAEQLEDVFAEVARVIARECGPLQATAEPEPWEHVSVSSGDLTTLLADWANELVGRSEAAQLAYVDIRSLALSDKPGHSSIDADVRGIPVKQWVSPLKAATYHGLSVQAFDGGWRAEILFDV